MMGSRGLMLALVAAPLLAMASGGGLSDQEVQRWMQTRLAVHAVQPSVGEGGQLVEAAQSRVTSAGYSSVAAYRAHGLRIREAMTQLQRPDADVPALQQQLEQIKDLRAAGMLDQREYVDARDTLEAQRNQRRQSRRDWPAVEARLDDLLALQAYLDGRRDSLPAW